MTGPYPQKRLDQVFFGWSQRQGGQSAMADSFGDTEERDRWLYRLRAHLRLQRLPDTELPDSALSYFTFPDGMAALLRRVPAGVSTGRNNSHALIGPAALLTPRAALGIQDWTGWLDEPPDTVMAPAPDTLVDQALQRAETKLRPSATAKPAVLVPILAAMLAEPDLPISVIGCPETLKTAMIWALVDIAEHTGTPLPDPSFSTYESQHDESVESPAHLLFLPGWPFERGEVRRTIVDLTQPAPDGPQMERARRLYRQLADGWPAPKPDVRYPDSVEPEPRWEPDREPSRQAVPGPSGGPVTLEDRLVATLLEATSQPDLDRVLREIRRLPFEGRQAVRARLDARVLDEVALRIEVDFRDEQLRRLLEAVYGPELADLGDPQTQRHAVEAVRTGGSEQVALILSEARSAAQGVLPSEAYRRWADAARKARPEPGARILRRIRGGRRNRWVPLVAAVSVLLVAFLSGLVVGSFGGDDGPADNTEASSSAPATTGTSSAPEPVPADRSRRGYARINPPEKGEFAVFAFIRAVGGLLPQGPCTRAFGNVWSCWSRDDQPGEVVAIWMTKEAADGLLESSEPVPEPTPWGNSSPVR